MSVTKKIFIWCVFLLFALTVSAAADPIDDVDVDKMTGEVTITGQTDHANQTVTLQVLFPEKQADELINNTDKVAVLQTLNHLYETVSDENKEYTFSYVMDGESGIYNVRVMWSGRLEPYILPDGFLFSNPFELELVLSQLNACDDAEDLKGIVESNAEILDIDETLYEKLLDVKKRNLFESIIAIRKGLTGKIFADISEFVDAINPRIATQFVNQSSSTAEVLQVLRPHMPEWRMYSIYDDATFSSEVKVSCDQLVTNRTDYKTLDDIQDWFNQYVAYQLIYRAGGWEDIYDILTTYNDVYLLDLDDYMALDETKDIDKALIGRLYTSRIKLSEAFDAAYTAMHTKKTTENNRYSPSGGGVRTGKMDYIGNFVDNVDVSTPIPTKVFSDLESVPWAVESINGLSEMNIIQGRQNNVFAPDDMVTREEFVKMLVLAFDLYDSDSQINFEDVTDDKWYYHYIGSGVNAQITNGVSDDLFGIGMPITRQDMSVMLYNALPSSIAVNETESNSSRFEDFTEIASYAHEGVLHLANIGVINGVSERLFAPTQNATRAQAAKIIYTALVKEGIR